MKKIWLTKRCYFQFSSTYSKKRFYFFNKNAGIIKWLQLTILGKSFFLNYAIHDCELRDLGRI